MHYANDALDTAAAVLSLDAHANCDLPIVTSSACAGRAEFYRGRLRYVGLQGYYERIRPIDSGSHYITCRAAENDAGRD